MRDIVALLQHEAKRYPEVQQLISRVQDMSNDEILSCKLPAAWMKGGLIELKNRLNAAITNNLVLDNIIDGEVIDPIGYTVIWDGDTIYIGSKWALEVTSNTLIFCCANGGMWIGSTFIPKSDPRITDLPRVEHTSRSLYIRKYIDSRH